MEAFNIKQLKAKAKETFRHGSVPKTIQVLEDEVLKGARESKDDFNILEALMLYARIELETGKFP